MSKSWFRVVLPLLITGGIANGLVPAVAGAEEASQDQAVTAQPVKVALPNPLTLEYLLNDFTISGPELALQKARIAQLQAETLLSNNAFQADLQARLGRREFAEEDQPHNLLALHIGKVLYDFGRESLRQEAIAGQLSAEQSLTASVEERQKLDVMQAYFNVLLADFQFRIDNEAMAVEYVSYDKAKDFHDVGQVSDVDLLAAENRYQTILLSRSRAEQKQLQTRIQLANVIGAPNARPDELKMPDLALYLQRDAKDLELTALQGVVIQQNPQLVALNAKIQAQQSAIASAAKSGMPTIRGDAWVGSLSSYPEIREGRWRADLTLNVPIMDGGLSDLAKAQAQAKLAEYEALYQQLAQQLREQVADLYFQIKLLETEKKKHQTFGDYADLYLDYSRALYENEVSTDFGDAMVRLSQANYDMVAWRFKQALLWAQLDYLSGKPLMNLKGSQG
ncbi:TolC family protein [Thiomicrorhabdus heinhorstiae]|uniref:TolC family protein n=1 Tax=Thiomicrorhabdus heinhorstiae TaxID=2748010 RepID=A0ABS0BWS9_9GAMM|nr:TolC family protein [Thiomicrorhabdus heinhorstiae]MBF6058263.1 TolC family protein [Thiomicrorhabdus heinhorstiae]